jgi:hypothetical protein
MRGKKIDMNKKSCLKKIESIIAKESKSWIKLTLI